MTRLGPTSRQWVDVNSQPEYIELSTHREGLVTSSPDPLTLCGRRNMAPSFKSENAHFPPSIYEAMK